MEEETIMEERQELMVKMVSPDPTKPNNPTRKIARFLKPTATSIDIQKPFSPNHSSVSKIDALKVSFNGFRIPQRGWKDWVDSMHSLHKFTWIKAGIHDAVLNSVYEIKKDDNLILGFAEKWCDKTKSFVFDWGEVTITLEDMMALGGYSVLGQYISTPVEENDESKSVLAKLKEARTELNSSRSKKADQSGWMKKFKDSGSEIEHEAFLVLWLTRFVFPSSYDAVTKNVLPIGISLAKGIKLALAPAVLASIYRDLRLLNANVVSLENNDQNDETMVTVWAPLQLVQIWIWERFPKLRPNPGDTCNPMFAKWDKKKGIIGSNIDCAFEDFCWQPYGKNLNDDSVFWDVYQEIGNWVVVGDCLNEGLESWARCLRVSELVGIDGDCIEQSLPHRVARQFGMNQDVPGDVARTNESPETASRFYSRPVKDIKLYLPSRISEPYVTVRYVEWWKKSTKEWSESRTERSKISMSSNATAAAAADDDGGGDGVGIVVAADDDIYTLALKLEARISKVEEAFAHKKDGD